MTKEISPVERRRRMRRDTRLDIVLRKIREHGLDSLSKVERVFLGECAKELRDELGWNDPFTEGLIESGGDDPSGQERD